LWEFLLLSICGLEEFMGIEQTRISQIKMRGHHATTCSTGQADFQSQSEAPVAWQTRSLFVITLSLLAYGGYLAWDNLTQVLQPTATPASTILTIVAMGIQVVVHMLPSLSCAVIYLTSRRDTPWFLRHGALCVLGLVTAAIEMFVRFSG
jgi:hypothetical protein